MLYEAFILALVSIAAIFLTKKCKRFLKRLKYVKDKLQYTDCSSPNCVRCNRSKITLKSAKQLFDEKFASDPQLFVIGLSLQKQSKVKNSQHIILIDGLTENFSVDRLGRDLFLLEENWKTISQEYKVIRQHSQGWQLNCAGDGTQSWRVFNLINQGAWVKDNCRLCPRTCDILIQLSQLMTGCAFGYVFFSVLPRNTQINEHCGPTNTRIRCHLGLQIPKDDSIDLSMIVNNEKVTWTKGKCLLFDDSLMHSVNYETTSRYGTSAKERVVLLIDFWHTQLTLYERNCLRELFPANDV